MHKKVRLAIAAASIGIAAFGLTACNNNDSAGSSKESTTMEKMEKSSESMTPSDSMMMSEEMAPSDAMMPESNH